MENVTLFSTSVHLIASTLRSGKDHNLESAFAHFAISRLRNFARNSRFVPPHNCPLIHVLFPQVFTQMLCEQLFLEVSEDADVMAAMAAQQCMQ